MSKDLPNIHAPIKKWEKEGICTVINDVEISAEIPVQWFAEQSLKYNIVMIGIDGFRHTWLNKEFKKIGFDAFDKDNKRIYIVRPSDIAKTSAVINSAFLRHAVSGWDRMMCWYTNNSKKVLDQKGNIYYGKIEPKLRKTDGFTAWAHSMCCLEFLPEYNDFPNISLNVAIY